MLASACISTGIPVLKLTDTCGFALQLMEDYDLQHLPVSDNEKFTGLVDREAIENADEASTMADMEAFFIHTTVQEHNHFLSLLKTATISRLSLVPVVNKAGELLGCVRLEDLMQPLAHYLSVEEGGGVIVLQMEKRNFSLGELCRLVETNDAVINQVNSNINPVTNLLEVTLKINKNEISDVIATLQRYEYDIKYYFGEEDYENELRENYDNLMTYLKI